MGGHGRRMVRTDGRVYNFISHKACMSHMMKRNPREIPWTVLYRRKHKKGQQEELTKRRTRRTQKFTRAITGATLSDIMAKRNQKPEVRKAQRNRPLGLIKKNKRLKKQARRYQSLLKIRSQSRSKPRILEARVLAALVERDK